jgi:hypothetical protein
MRLLLDECVPKRLKHDLTGHDVRHVVEMGWSAKRNGDLLKLMLGEGFEALLTSTSTSSCHRMSADRESALSWYMPEPIG